MPRWLYLCIGIGLLTLSGMLVLAGPLQPAHDGRQQVRNADRMHTTTPEPRAEIPTSSGAVTTPQVVVHNTTASNVAPRDNITVITADSIEPLTDTAQAPTSRRGSELVALAPNGSIYYHNTTHSAYWDIDPVPGTATTIEYVYSDHFRASECPYDERCTRNGVERVNLTTGETTQLFSRLTRDVTDSRWHDVDRIGTDQLLVADIHQDRAFIVNETTNETVWEWTAETDFNYSSGGSYPEDWTHINDVEYVEISGEPTVMVNLRNHDQVVFVDRDEGLLENWTLGTDENHTVLYEQHNPDYISPSNGGPALLVADSENNRIVEYQRENDSWQQTWEWQDTQLAWPRDADRLPNGHTVVTDSHGDRVFELNENGTIVWSIEVGFPYEVERLGTGDESTNGESIAASGPQNGTGNLSQYSRLAGV